MRKLKEFWNTLPQEVTVARREGIMIVTIGTLIGVILGMLCSPKMPDMGVIMETQ